LSPLPSDQELLATVLHYAREGHICTPPDLILPTASPALHSLIHFYEGSYYLKRNWNLQQRLVAQIQRLLHGTIEPVSLPSLPLPQEQQQALAHVITHPVTFLTGGPGTGKTYTAGQLIQAFPEWKVILAAPTGKAAHLLQSKLRFHPHLQAGTLHRLLRYREYEPLDVYVDADLIVIDEASMIDLPLMTALFSAVRKGTRLLICGDPFQLPSIEAGSIFADLVEDCPFRCHLNLSHRTNLTSILTLAHQIQAGDVDQITPFPLPSALTLAREISRHFPSLETPLKSLKHWQNYRALTPLRHGPYGVESLNRRVDQLLQAPHQPILITANDERLQLFNGETGVLAGNEAWFDDGRCLNRASLPAHELAYCLTVHKSQGSEFDHVALILSEGAEQFGREMLYTAATRAKKCLEIYGSKEILCATAAKKTVRHSGLKSLLPYRLSLPSTPKPMTILPIPTISTKQVPSVSPTI